MLLALLCVTFLLAAAIWWLGHRHSAVAAWDRELRAAFGGDDRPDLPRRPVL